MSAVLMLIQAIVLLVFGLGCLFVPDLFWSVFGITFTPGSQLVTRAFGGVILGNVLEAWLIRKSADPSALRIFVLEQFVAWGVSLVVSLIGVLGGVMNALGWAVVVLSLFWTVLAAYDAFLKPRPA